MPHFEYRNNMLLKPILSFAHQLLQSSLKMGDNALDGTMGNGNDTLFLAQCVGDSGRVFAFDIQAAAIAATSQKLQQHQKLECVTLLHTSHANIAQYVTEKLAAAIFNFGYLPRGDHNITTLPESSLVAIEATLNLLKDNGLLVLVVYRGHEMGKHESQAIGEFVAHLPQNRFRVLRYEFVNQQNFPPFILAIEKLPEKG